MSKKKKAKVEFRYYEMPADSHILALLGDKWIQHYGRGLNDLHFHNYMEIGYCYYGVGDLVLEDSVYPFSGNTFSVIPSNVLHTTKSKEGTVSRWEYLYVDVGGYLNELYSENSYYKNLMLDRINGKAWYLEGKEYPFIDTLIRKILDEMREKKDYYQENVQGGVYQLMAEIARLSAPESSKIGLPLHRKNDLLSQAVEYIHMHYAEEIRVGDLAELCYISENYFRQIFRERMHMSPAEYVNLVRIHAACDLLRKTQEPIASVAGRTGFQTLSTFNRNFRKFLGGVTPCEWRKRPEHYEQKLKAYWIATEKGW